MHNIRGNVPEKWLHISIYTIQSISHHNLHHLVEHADKLSQKSLAPNFHNNAYLSSETNIHIRIIFAKAMATKKIKKMTLKRLLTMPKWSLSNCFGSLRTLCLHNTKSLTYLTLMSLILGDCNLRDKSTYGSHSSRNFMTKIPSSYMSAKDLLCFGTGA